MTTKILDTPQDLLAPVSGWVVLNHIPVPPPQPRGGGTPDYPILTEDMGYPPSPLSSDGAAAPSGPSGSFGPTVSKALQDVLGWKIKSNDPKGFVGALSQSFQIETVEGSVVSTWTPRSYAVQTDLAGGVTGAQASVFTMANTLVEQMLPLIDGLTPLDPACDLLDAAATKGLVKSQLTDLAAEIGNLGGPRVMRVHQYFQLLQGVSMSLTLPQPPSSTPPPTLTVKQGHPPARSPLLSLVPPKRTATYWSTLTTPTSASWTNPDTVLGSLGELRDLLGLFQTPALSFVNTVDDEQNVTNFRIVVDYATSLLTSWTNSIQFFAGVGTPFLGTQLVLISRQLGVISEVVDEVRFVLDSVLVRASQRQALLLDFSSIHRLPNLPTDPNSLATSPSGVPLAQSNPLPPIYLEDLLSWVQNFVTTEAPPVIQDAGRLGVGTDFLKMISELVDQAYALYMVAPSLGGGMGTGRVLQSLYKLLLRLNELYLTAAPVSVAYIGPRP